MTQKTLSTSITTPIVVWPANLKRSYLLIQNQSAGIILVAFDSSPSAGIGYLIAPGAEYSPVNPPKAEIRVRGNDASLTNQVFFSVEESSK